MTGTVEVPLTAVEACGSVGTPADGAILTRTGRARFELDGRRLTMDYGCYYLSLAAGEAIEIYPSTVDNGWVLGRQMTHNEDPWEYTPGWLPVSYWEVDRPQPVPLGPLVPAPGGRVAAPPRAPALSYGAPDVAAPCAAPDIGSPGPGLTLTEHTRPTRPVPSISSSSDCCLSDETCDDPAPPTGAASSSAGAGALPPTLPPGAQRLDDFLSAPQVLDGTGRCRSSFRDLITDAEGPAAATAFQSPVFTGEGSRFGAIDYSYLDQRTERLRLALALHNVLSQALARVYVLKGLRQPTGLCQLIDDARGWRFVTPREATLLHRIRLRANVARHTFI